MNGEIISLGDTFHMKLGLMVTMRWVIMMMMSKYFDEIVAHVGYKIKKNEQRFDDDDLLHDKDKVIIQVCEENGEEVDFLFFKGLIEVYLEDGAYFEYSSREHNLPFKRSLHALAAMYPGKPLTLEYYALKKFAELGIPLSELPTKALRDQATKGFLSTKKEAEEFVNNEGKDYLEWNCGNIDSDESMTSF